MNKKVECKVVIGTSENMKELGDESIHLAVTSPPYYNAPFDYPNHFKNYNEFLMLIKKVGKELKRVLAKGRIACFICDDTLIKGKKYPVVADITRTLINTGFKYRERLVWLKPEGYIRISRRSGILLQHPYPMYYYPDNIQESILIFQKGNYDYTKTTKEQKNKSQIDINEVQKQKWYLNTWHITNVLPLKNRLETNIAAFPETIPYRLIKLFSHKQETVLDPFTGSGTTLKVATQLDRNAVGYEIDPQLLPIIKEKLGVTKTKQAPSNINFKLIRRRKL